MTQIKQSVWSFAKRYPILVLFVASYTVVHVTFEHSFWFTPHNCAFTMSPLALLPLDQVRASGGAV